ncbi:hypothetical protein [Sphingopyxis flava]|uniref:Uncharacterized protein n=1 Tax=Sphingopyxis flava TaxID=1507287 RepID=A0A1T5BHY8_9SPHN|nr:hypothetical protein [Sphingopyxis flava]SKB46932.1 hypothetical protein SAMN06295937_1006195 [Sphingopyxis flava]
MTIRAAITVLAIPLFLGILIINGLLLHNQDRAEMERALLDQALTTAVTVAQFVREMDAPATQLAVPVRAKALRAALGHVTDLDGLYLVQPDRSLVPLRASSVGWDAASLAVPGKAYSVPSGSRRRGDRWVTALAPAGKGRFVAARFNAEPIDAHMDGIRRDIALIAVGLALFALLLASVVARRIAREIDDNRRGLEQGYDVRAADMSIREARDLADAARLMRTSRRAAEDRRTAAIARSEGAGDRDDAIRKSRSMLFPPIRLANESREIAMRMCGDVTAGSFFAHAGDADDGLVVIGCCRACGDVAALAAAYDVRRLIEGCHDADAATSMLERLALLYRFDALVHLRWRAAAPQEGERLLVLADAETEAKIREWCAISAGLAPAAILANIEVLLAPDAIIALVGTASSADGAECGVDVGLDREDRAEAADVEHFAHRSGQS